jgi:hypothetical protein
VSWKPDELKEDRTGALDHLSGRKDGSHDRHVTRFRVLGIGSDANRAVAAVLGDNPSNRIADKCARLYRPTTLVALRRGPETYETAALPLSYVGRSRSIGDAIGLSPTPPWQNASDRAQDPGTALEQLMTVRSSTP